MSLTSYRLGVLDGDGIGPEIVPASVAVADAALDGAPRIEWVELPFGATAIDKHGSAAPMATLAALAELDGWLLGPHDSAAYPESHRLGLNPSGTIRKHFAGSTMTDVLEGPGRPKGTDSGNCGQFAPCLPRPPHTPTPS